MPALLGYLVAVAVFFGSGYLGLAWLAAPDDTSTHQRSSDQSTSHSPNVSSKKPTASVADAKEAGVGTKAETTPEGNPTGGCKPIGLTANGEMVFPLQCRELVERQRGPAASLPSVQTAPAPAQNEVQDSGTHKRNDKSDNAVIGAATQPGTSAERKLVEEKDKTKPPNALKSESNRKGADQAATSPNEVAPDDGLASSPAKRTGQRSAVEAKPKKAETPGPGPEPERSKLVMMTLETIEFPDGHREQRLVPLKHSPRTAVQSDWYNPLGLR